MQDERRLYYVGITRAQELATVLKVTGSETPFASEVLQAQQFSEKRIGEIHEQWAQVKNKVPERLKIRQMGLGDIWSQSFAREQTKWFDRDKVQGLLKVIPIGEPLEFHRSEFAPTKDGICAVEIHYKGLKLGSLSQATARQFQNTEGVKVEVGAVIQNWKNEDDEYATLDKYYAVLPRVITT